MKNYIYIYKKGVPSAKAPTQGGKQLKKGVPSAVGFPHCAGSGEGLFLSPEPYPHKCAEAGTRTRDLLVTDGRLYRCTRPALQGGKQLLKWNSTSKSKCLMKYQKILPFNRLATIASMKTSISTRSCIAPFNRLAGQHNITAKCKD